MSIIGDNEQRLNLQVSFECMHLYVLTKQVTTEDSVGRQSMFVKHAHSQLYSYYRVITDGTFTTVQLLQSDH